MKFETWSHFLATKCCNLKWDAAAGLHQKFSLRSNLCRFWRRHGQWKQEWSVSKGSLQTRETASCTLQNIFIGTKKHNKDPMPTICVAKCNVRSGSPACAIAFCNGRAIKNNKAERKLVAHNTHTTTLPTRKCEQSGRMRFGSPQFSSTAQHHVFGRGLFLKVVVVRNKFNPPKSKQVVIVVALEPPIKILIMRIFRQKSLLLRYKQ